MMMTDAKLAAVAAARGGKFQTCRICNQFEYSTAAALHQYFKSDSTVSQFSLNLSPTLSQSTPYANQILSEQLIRIS